MEQDTNQTSTEDVQDTNPQETVTETHQESNAEDFIDYKHKFSESSKEALRLLEENKAKEAEIERLRQLAEQSAGANYSDNSENLYPGFEHLEEEERRNLLEYTNSIKESVRNEMYKDPALAFAKETYNEKKWGDAFEQVAAKFPDLRESKDEFRAKYYNPNNVPSNIDVILEDLAKVHLFDKARDIGANDAREQADRIEVERAKGGDKTPTSTRSLEDWQRMAASNPAEFAKLSEQFNEDMNSGKLK